MVFGSLWDAVTSAASFLLLVRISFLHGMAASTGLSKFLLAFFKGFHCTHGHPDQWSTFLSVVEHCRVLASRFSILVFLDSERLSQFWSILQAYMIWSRSRLNFCQSLSRTTFFPRKLFLSIEWTSWNFSTNLTSFCSNRHSNCYRHVALAWRPDQWE